MTVATLIASAPQFSNWGSRINTGWKSNFCFHLKSLLKSSNPTNFLNDIRGQARVKEMCSEILTLSTQKCDIQNDIYSQSVTLELQSHVVDSDDVLHPNAWPKPIICLHPSASLTTTKFTPCSSTSYSYFAASLWAS